MGNIAVVPVQSISDKSSLNALIMVFSSGECPSRPALAEKYIREFGKIRSGQADFTAQL